MKKKKRKFVDYYEYIKSDEWNERRLKFMNSKKGRGCCRICKTKKNLHVHHTTYKDLGDEKDHHLTTLCAEHHKGAHEYICEKEKSIYQGTSEYIYSMTKGKHGTNPVKKSQTKKKGKNKEWSKKEYLLLFDTMNEYLIEVRDTIDTEKKIQVNKLVGKLKKKLKFK